MPTINTADTFTKSGVGFEQLAASNRLRSLTFSGTSVGTTTEVQAKNDDGTFATLENGDITALPRSIEMTLNADLQIVTTGTPDFKVTITVS